MAGAYFLGLRYASPTHLVAMARKKIMRNTVFHVSPKLAMYSSPARTPTVSDTRVMTVPFFLLFFMVYRDLVIDFYKVLAFCKYI